MVGPSQNIALYGFMASGKTTIARLLAKRWGWKSCDLDRQIELREKISVAQIFARYGEAYFRKCESTVLRQGLAISRTAHILSLGGGSLLGSTLKQLVQSKYRILTLLVPFSILVERIVQSNRPLRTNAKTLYEQRQAHYRSVGEPIRIQKHTPEQVVSLIEQVIL